MMHAIAGNEQSNQTFYVDAICHVKPLHFYMYKVYPGV